MDIVLDFDRWRVYSVPEEACTLPVNSKYRVGLLLKLMLWPDCRMAIDWFYDVSHLTSVSGGFMKAKKASFEYVLDAVGRCCNKPKLFYLLTPAVENRARRAKWELSMDCGAPRSLCTAQLAYGLWIYYRTAKVSDWAEVNVAQKWFDIVKRNPEEWESLAGIPATDARCFSEVKKYVFHIEW